MGSNAEHEFARLVADVLAEPDNNDQWDDGYRRPPRLVRATDQEAANDWAQRTADALEQGLGERKHELCQVHLRMPEPGTSYEFGGEHEQRILEAGGRPNPEQWGSGVRMPEPGKSYEFEREHEQAILEAGGRANLEEWGSRVLTREEWTEPRIMLFSNADALARVPDDEPRTRVDHSHWLRLLSDLTRIRAVWFGSEPVWKLSFVDTSTGARMKRYDVRS